MRTRVFKSGNSQAVRIPAELALPPEVKEVEIEAVPGGFIVRQPVERKMKLSDIFAAMGPEWFPDGKRPDPGEEPERNWGQPPQAGAQDERSSDVPPS